MCSTTGKSEFDYRQGKCINFLHSLQNPTILLVKCYQGLYPLGQHSRNFKLTSVFHLIPRFKVYGAAPLMSYYDIIIIDNQQDATILIYLFLIGCTCFGRCFRPSSGAYHCNYIFWYCPPMLLLAGVAYWVELPEAVITVICS